MAIDDNLFIHVGLPKTGTTFLQKKVFPKIEGINYISDHNEGGRVIPIFEKIKDDKINLISCEAFSHGIGERYLEKKYASRCEIARRLNRMFPKAKIIVTFRNKEDWLNSFYNQYYKKDRGDKGDYSFARFKREILLEDDLNFHEYEECLRKLFDQVLVLKYEELKKNPDSFIGKICDFMGVEHPVYKNISVNKSHKKNLLKNDLKRKRSKRILKKVGIPESMINSFDLLLKRINT